jgi:hypothetical protein
MDDDPEPKQPKKRIPSKRPTLQREKSEEEVLPRDVIADAKVLMELEGKWKTLTQTLRHRDLALGFILIIYALLLTATVVIIFFQGFGFHGFKLGDAFLNWLGGATIAEVAVIAGVVFRSLFKSERNDSPSQRNSDNPAKPHHE